MKIDFPSFQGFKTSNNNKNQYNSLLHKNNADTVSFSGTNQDKEKEEYLYLNLKAELAKVGIRLSDRSVSGNDALIQTISDIANSSIEQNKEARIKKFTFKPSKNILNERSTIVGSVGKVYYILKADKPIRPDKKLHAEIDVQKEKLVKKFDGYKNIQSGIAMAMNSLKQEATTEAFKPAITDKIIDYAEFLNLSSNDSLYLKKLNHYPPKDIEDRLNAYSENAELSRFMVDGLMYNMELHDGMGDLKEYNTTVSEKYGKVIDFWTKIIDKEDLDFEYQPIQIFESNPSKEPIAEKLKKFESLSEEDTENLIKTTAFILTKNTMKEGLRKQFISLLENLDGEY